MISGVPNFTMVIGYTNASWTLKADLVNRVRLPAAQPPRRRGLRLGHPRRARPRAPTSRSSTSRRVTCSGAWPSLPKQGRRTPWRLHQNYVRDVRLMRRGPLDDEGMTFQRRVPATTTEKAVV